MASMEAFRKESQAQILRAEKQGWPHVEINARELHRVVSPTENRHRMACEAMRGLQAVANQVIHVPPAGDGPSFTIRYTLPRA